jgi:hypothetical protein
MGREICLERRFYADRMSKKGKEIKVLETEEFPLYDCPTEVALEAAKNGNHRDLYFNWLRRAGFMNSLEIFEHSGEINKFCKTEGTIDFRWGIS